MRFGRRLLFGGAAAALLLAALPGAAAAAEAGAIDTGDTAWLLVATAMVMVMLPGLALFYGGLVRRKNVLSTIMTASSAWPWSASSGSWSASRSPSAPTSAGSA